VLAAQGAALPEGLEGEPAHPLADPRLEATLARWYKAAEAARRKAQAGAEAGSEE
jgi:hypothetical protein